jgi:hypothetical protein
MSRERLSTRRARRAGEKEVVGMVRTAMTNLVPTDANGLAAEIASILRGSSGRDVRPREASLVWDIRLPGVLSRLFGGRQRAAAVQAMRDRILQSIRESSESILMTHQEPPTEYEVPGSWTQVGSWCYRLPKDVELHAREAQAWLSLAGWTIFQAHEPPADWNAQMLRRSPAEIVTWMRSRQVSVLVDSFLDNVEWTIAVDPDRIE